MTTLQEGHAINRKRVQHAQMGIWEWRRAEFERGGTRARFSPSASGLEIARPNQV